MRLKVLAFASLLAFGAAGTGCGERPSNTTTKSVDANEVPTEAKAAFPEAQTVTAQHKELTSEQIASIEKKSGAKLSGEDFHSFVAHDSSRKQLGLATLTDVEGSGSTVRLLVVYTNDLKVKKVTPVEGSGDVVSLAFLGQFAGKDHDQPFHVGEDVEYGGKNRVAAEAVAHALKRDVLAMQALYGKTHGH